MLVNVNKVIIDYQKYEKVLSFSKKNKNFLLIQGFFGSVSFKIPKGVIIDVCEKNIILYFYSGKGATIYKYLKSFYFLIIFSSYGLVFNHFVGLSIKGIGFKFELKGDDIMVYSGNSLPTVFNVPEGFKILGNGSSNNFSVLGGDYTFLNNFVNKVRNIAVPNKYKEIGIFLEKKL